MSSSASQSDEEAPSLSLSDYKTARSSIKSISRLLSKSTYQNMQDETELSRQRWELKLYISDMIDAFRRKVAAGAEIPTEIEVYRRKFASRVESRANSSNTTPEKPTSNSVGVANGLSINMDRVSPWRELLGERSEVLQKLETVAASADDKSGWLAKLLDKEYWREMGSYEKWAGMYEFVYRRSVEETAKQRRDVVPKIAVEGIGKESENGMEPIGLGLRFIKGEI
ncbi:uncharacterized protein BDZ99DRAFT_517620 [Mytilinidion resinicola]|uniref:Uncharacterized protein n=1 Tax=Mytilinidion resinicola TaxID=574789 RepID=A0A6A6YX18_9PEZI|nr:uncharacterized protein BDZ99DRAFT_517620 [Mytilinidion resinicola]KAF2813351.1 hypothetical protein BDZ99DRAFT_517620 [Mytilinidion resinicola]